MNGAITVVVVNYNTCEHLEACLKSVRAAGNVPAVVLDNASTDGSVEMVRGAFPQVTRIENPRNVGFGKGANLAMEGCETKYVLLLNSDTRIQTGTCDALIRYLDENPKVAIAGPRIVGHDGEQQASAFHFPTPLFVLLQENKLGALLQRLPFVREWYSPSGSQRRVRRVPWVLGAAMAIRREAFDAVRGFDESFFMYYEEVDLCYRLRSAGWEIDFVPDATVMHEGAASTRQQRSAMTVLQYESLIRFYEKHYARARQRALRLVLGYLMLRNLALGRVHLARAQNGQVRAEIVESMSGWKQVLAMVWRDTAARGSEAEPEDRAARKQVSRI
jgi:GT2 family glycosyltransferase